MRFGVLIGVIAALAAAQAAHNHGFIPGALSQTSSPPRVSVWRLWRLGEHGL